MGYNREIRERRMRSRRCNPALYLKNRASVLSLRVNISREKTTVEKREG